MTQITISRAVVEQVLEALRHVVRQAQENLVPTIHYGPVHDAMNRLEAALAEPQEPDLSRCPKCNGPADNGHDREVPPNPYYCTKCMAEPVAWRFEARHIDSAWAAAVTLKHPGPEGVYMRNVTPLYTAPPRKPLAEAAQEPQGCDHCNHPLYAATKCRVCGRVTEAAP